MYIDDEYKTYVNSSGLIYSGIFSFVGGWGLEGDPCFIRIRGMGGGVHLDPLNQHTLLDLHIELVWSKLFCSENW